MDREKRIEMLKEIIEPSIIDRIEDEKDKQLEEKKAFINLYNDYKELQDRIDKAKEYIEENQEKQYAMNYEYGLSYNELPKLLDILKGSDEK